MRWTPIAVMMLSLRATTELSAQASRLHLTPFGGAFIPTKELGRLPVLSTTGNSVSVDGKLVTTVGAGGRFAYWIKERTGLEASYFFSRADLRVTDGNVTALFDAVVHLASIKALYQVSRGTSGTDFVVNGGLAGVRHGGPGFGLVSSNTDLGGVVGSGLYITMGPQVRLRLDGELFVHRWSAGPQFGARTQADIVVTAGLALQLVR